MIRALVVLAAGLVAAGPTLVAVQKARTVAAAAGCRDNLRMLAAGCQRYAARSDGRLPGDPDRAFLPELLPFVGGLPHPTDWQRFDPYQPGLLCPADPTYRPMPPAFEESPRASYAGNRQVFASPRPPTLPGGFKDGTASTALLTEHYTRCRETGFYWDAAPDGLFSTRKRLGCVVPHDRDASADRRPPFQLRPCDWVWPPHGRVNVFDEAPPPDCGDRPPCNYRLAQSSHAEGLPVAFADGSVWQVAAGVSPAVFWAMFTPAGGD